ncbi:MAG: argininosuccinate lyase [Candidatus Auribacterota bacterium]|jgi:argininosuccinate lyase|nr:argininosuccinate lyase [Candidatus Auribacterota bacterium]
MGQKKLWAGRFTQQTDEAAERFSSSIQYDKRLYLYDIEGSMAHAVMLASAGIISDSEKERIINGLEQIKNEIESGTFEFRVDREDIHMNIEARLIELTGDAGEKLHTARSRNDQVLTDVRLYLLDAVDNIICQITALQQAFLHKAVQYKNDIMPGFTHMQHAQPVIVAHHLMAYISMLERDKERFSGARARINISPLGACAMAGTALPIDRQMTAHALGFDAVSRNSIDTVSSRDFIIEVLSDCAILGSHLSRLAEELVIWMTPQFRFVALSDAYCTGSSIMPQKKNPDMAELIRGKTGRLNGNLIALLTTVKGLPLSYNRDLQEDKEPLFDSIDTVTAMLTVAQGMIRTMHLNKERMRACADSGFSLATDIADYLVGKHIPFRKAHEIVGAVVAYCIEKNKDFAALDMNEWKSFSDVFGSDIKDMVGADGIDRSVAAKKSEGSTSPAEVERQINHWETILGVL